MNPLDEKQTREFAQSLAYTGVDTCHLLIEVRGGFVTIGGTVPSVTQRRLLWAVLETAGADFRDIDCRVAVLESAPLVVSARALTVRMAHQALQAVLADHLETLHLGVTALQG